MSTMRISATMSIFFVLDGVKHVVRSYALYKDAAAGEDTWQVRDGMEGGGSVNYWLAVYIPPINVSVTHHGYGMSGGAGDGNYNPGETVDLDFWTTGSSYVIDSIERIGVGDVLFECVPSISSTTPGALTYTFTIPDAPDPWNLPPNELIEVVTVPVLANVNVEVRDFDTGDLAPGSASYELEKFFMDSNPPENYPPLTAGDYQDGYLLGDDVDLFGIYAELGFEIVMIDYNGGPSDPAENGVGPLLNIPAIAEDTTVIIYTRPITPGLQICKLAVTTDDGSNIVPSEWYVGDSGFYKIEVRNYGNVIFDEVLVVDEQLDVSWTLYSFGPTNPPVGTATNVPFIAYVPFTIPIPEVAGEPEMIYNVASATGTAGKIDEPEYAEDSETIYPIHRQFTVEIKEVSGSDDTVTGVGTTSYYEFAPVERHYNAAEGYVIVSVTEDDIILPKPPAPIEDPVFSNPSISQDHVVIVEVAQPHILVTKTAVEADGSDEPKTSWNEDQEVWYKIYLENTGTKDFNEVEIIDDDINFSTTIGSLDAGENQTVYASYHIPISGELPRSFTNTVTAIGYDEFNESGLVELARATAMADINVTSYNPGLEVIKTAVTSDDGSDIVPSEWYVGDSGFYKIEVRNDGDITFDEVLVNDVQLDMEWILNDFGPTNPPVAEAVNTPFIEYVAFTIPIPEVPGEPETIHNVATASGTSPLLQVPEYAEDDETISPTHRQFEVVIKEASGSEDLVTGVGNDTYYEFESVERYYNAIEGYVVTSVTEDDALLPEPLAPVDNHVFTDLSITENHLIIIEVAEPIINVSKTAVTSNDGTDDLKTSWLEDQTVWYKIVVENSGTKVFDKVVIIDDDIGFSTTIDKLDAGGTQAVYAPYQIPTGGSVPRTFTNTVTAIGYDEFSESDPVELTRDTATEDIKIIEPDKPAISVIKNVVRSEENPDSKTSWYKGRTVTFEIVIKNVGNVDLYNVVLDDKLYDSDEELVQSLELNYSVVEVLEVGEAVKLYFTYEADSTGSFTNIAIVEAGDGDITDSDDAEFIVRKKSPDPKFMLELITDDGVFFDDHSDNRYFFDPLDEVNVTYTIIDGYDLIGFSPDSNDEDIIDNIIVMDSDKKLHLSTDKEIIIVPEDIPEEEPVIDLPPVILPEVLPETSGGTLPLSMMFGTAITWIGFILRRKRW